MFEHPRAAGDDLLKLVLGVEIQPHRNAEAVAQRIGQQPRARGGADQREFGQIDLHRTRRRSLADDEIELEILHRRIEHLLHRRIKPMNLVDEQHVALFEIGQQRREIAGLGDHRTGGGAEADAKLARHDLRQRGLAEPRGTDEQHVVERLAAFARGVDEHRQIGARLLLADKFRQVLRTQRGIADVVGTALGGDKAGRSHDGAPARTKRGRCRDEARTTLTWRVPSARGGSAARSPRCHRRHVRRWRSRRRPAAGHSRD